MKPRELLLLLGLSAGLSGIGGYISTEDGRKDIMDGRLTAVPITPATITAIVGLATATAGVFLELTDPE